MSVDTTTPITVEEVEWLTDQFNESGVSNVPDSLNPELVQSDFSEDLESAPTIDSDSDKIRPDIDTMVTRICKNMAETTVESVEFSKTTEQDVATFIAVCTDFELTEEVERLI